MLKNKTAIKLTNITKIYPNGIKANENINLELKYGQIHALLGENGAGKSTLVKIIFGEFEKTSGKIEINGKLINYHNPEISNANKIGIIHQHFSLIDDFSIYQNIILGNELKSQDKIKKIEEKLKNNIEKLDKWFKEKKYSKKNKNHLNIYEKKLNNLIFKKDKEIISWLSYNKENYKKLENLIKKYKLNLNLKRKIKDISINEQQKTEMLKLLSKESEIIIFDEPTSVLTLEEIKEFLKLLDKYRKAGKAILFITHKVDEIKEIADKVSIIRHGNIIGTYKTKDITIEEMISKMVEGERVFDLDNFKRKKVLDEKRLVVKNLNLLSNNKKECLHNVSFELNKGEIVGIAGIENNGQKQILETITGIEKNIDGKIYYDGNTSFFSNNFLEQKMDWKKNKVQTLKKHGISYVPRDRINEALLKNESLYINICFNSFGNQEYFSGIFGNIEYEKIKKITKNMCKKYNIKGTNDVEETANTLSGGNQQKFIIGREMLNDPELLLIDQPTWGIDKLSIGFIYEEFLKLRNRGKTILFTSTDLSEILSLSDRVIVLSKGRVMGEVNPKEKNALNKISQLITKGI